MTGKEKCEMLREIRAQVARENNIPLRQVPCDYQGEDCPGTCFACEREVGYLQKALDKRYEQGESVTLKRRQDETLKFRSETSPEDEEDMDDLVIDEVIEDETAPGEEDIRQLSRKLAEAGITTAEQIGKYYAEDLVAKCGLTPQELEAAKQIMAYLGRPWEKAGRRDRNRGIRGRMRSPNRKYPW